MEALVSLIRPRLRGTQRGDAGMVRVRVVLRVRNGRVGGGEQQLGMGSASGLDGRSTVIDGWVRTGGIEWSGPPGP